MDYYKEPANDYRENFKRGRIYNCCFPFLREKPIIVRPCHDKDSNSNQDIPADLIFVDKNFNDKYKMVDTFNHDGFKNLNLKDNEEFSVTKIKYRPVLLLSKAEGKYAKVAPIKTIKSTFKKYIDIEDLKNNQDSIEYFYLPPSSEFSIKKSIIFLNETTNVLVEHLDPKPVELKDEPMKDIDDKIIMHFNFYDITNSNSSELP